MAKTWAMIFGWIFVVIGVLGFIPNPIVGEGALFHTDAMHDVIHLIFGAILLWAAYRAPEKSRPAMKWLGIVYLVLAVLGFLMIGNTGVGSLLGLAEINGADNWLHVVLGVALIAIGWRKDRGVDMQTI